MRHSAAIRKKLAGLGPRSGWYHVGICLLGLVVLSAIAFGPYWFICWLAGFMKSGLLSVLFEVSALASWVMLLFVACRRIGVDMRRGQRLRAGVWFGLALGIVLAHILSFMGTTPSADAFFGHGLIARLQFRIDFDAVQDWIALVDPNDCLPAPHDAARGKYLSKEECPSILKQQNGFVWLELDAKDRPIVRLEWFQGKAGTWGLVIGCRDMTTPQSEPGTYGEKRTELCPGIYFWQIEG